MLSNYVISLIRTGVTVAAGALLTWLATTLHIVVDPTSQAGLVTLAVGLLSGAYYALARLVELKFPKAGVLLGVPAQPIYATAAATPPAAPVELTPEPVPPVPPAT